MARKDNREVAIVALREICDVLRKATPWVGISWVSWCGLRAVEALAGRLTIADIQFIVSIFTKFGSPLPPWLLAIAALVYGYLQRREKLRKTTYLQNRIIELESKLDSARSSSLLSQDGSTRKEDRL